MKLQYTTADGKLTVELEGESQKALFQELARFQEVFEDVPAAKIGKVEYSGGNVKYRVRKAKYTDEKGKEKTADYFEKVVTDGPLMWYKKSYGVLDDGTDGLFPKNKAPEGTTPGYNGWHKFEVEKKSSNATESVPFE